MPCCQRSRSSNPLPSSQFLAASLDIGQDNSALRFVVQMEQALGVISHERIMTPFGMNGEDVAILSPDIQRQCPSVVAQLKSLLHDVDVQDARRLPPTDKTRFHSAVDSLKDYCAIFGGRDWLQLQRCIDRKTQSLAIK